MWTVPAFAQVDTAWVRRYNGPGNGIDWAHAIAVDGSGNVYVTGGSDGSGTYDDYATIKYYPDGDTAWVRRYNGPGNSGDVTYAIAVDGSGNVYVTGSSATYLYGGDPDYATIKYGCTGNELWVSRYKGAGNGNDVAFAMAVDGAGNVYVTGQSYSSRKDYDYATIKYYPNGDTAWVRRYNGPGNYNDGALDIAVDGSGNVYVTGESYSTTSADCATIKYDSSGSELWVKRYNGPGNGSDWARAIAVNGSGNVYVTGQSSGDYVTIKYDKVGNELWVKRYDIPGKYDDQAYAIAVDGSDNVYVTGLSAQNSDYPYIYDYVTIKYDQAGNELWVRRYDGPGNDHDEVYAIAVDYANNIYVTGYSYGEYSWGRGTYRDYATIKYDEAGNELWVKRYDGPGNWFDEAYAIAVDDYGNVYVTGKSYSSDSDYDYATIKYVQEEVFVEEEDEENIIQSFALSQNYPNPFNPQTIIEYSLNFPSEVKARIYNIKGQLVKTLIDDHQVKGYHKVIWDGRNEKGEKTSSGIYFYQLRVKDYVEVKKMVKLR